jgi:3-oxoacyl-[acyl-carrier protein] reductase
MGLLSGKVAVVTGGDGPMGRGIAAALRTEGAAVGTPAPPSALADRAAFETTLSTLAGNLGGPIGIFVHAAVDPVALQPIPFHEIREERVACVWEQAMQSTIACCQASAAAMRGAGGRIVLVTPTVAMTGAAGYSVYAAAAEGQRLLARSLARLWAGRGITVNCVAPAMEALAEQPGPPGRLAHEGSVWGSALGRAGDPETDLGPLVALLSSDAGHFVTGVTICADGGSFMGI